MYLESNDYRNRQLPTAPSWIVQDPVLVSRVERPNRLNVLAPASPGTLQRSKSLTRPERKMSGVTPSRKNILEATPTSPYEPWVLFYNGITCCFPGSLLKLWGKDSQEKQRAWREKVALCSICAILCGALGFLTFGLQKSICKICVYYRFSR
jgi:hypothetical protein